MGNSPSLNPCIIKRLHMKKFNFCLVLLLTLGLLAPRLAAQEVEVVPGQILVQTLPGYTGSQVANFINERTENRAEVRSLRLVSKHMNIWQLSFDELALDRNEALRYAWQHPQVTVAQFNHVVTHRLVPNDANFSQQWQYINTGQGGGTPGADIDMDLAWDITTGGLTPLGDTIVACIIDDGLSATHADFGDNIWINHNEIPNNNIDDDNNGFVDDYRGWDAYNNTDNIYTGGGHGTPVAGIVGAQGNNGIGVAGVNWDVKLMIVRGGGNEAQALAAYSYPLELRKLYNQTNGALGAYVVTTNASWGVDYGQPSQAPMWCAMYDTLGAYGILSCGATANINLDVDTQGDLPTGCSSDYLISVTNMNRNDTKVTSAGYGTVSVDLGAFGQGTHTAASPNSYGGFGGTSGATPHVTGTAALLYSAACPNLTAVSKSAPDSAALLVRNFILDGVDANTSLAGITTTGGRLNVYKSLLALQAWDCTGSGCLSAFSLNTSNVSDTSATLVWNATASADSFHIEFRPVGAAIWTDFYTTMPSRQVDTLQACTEYEFRVETFCDTLNAAFTSVYIFKTDGCCEAPNGVSDSAYVAGAEITFDAVLAAQSYTLRYRVAGATNWTVMAGLNATNVTLSLDSCLDYEYQVQTVCDTGMTPFTPIATFRTKGCIGCLATFCAAAGNDDSDEWIARVAIANLTNTSTGNNGGYQDFTGQQGIFVNQDSTYDITLTPAFAGFPFDEFFKVWIDLNQDQVLDDSLELMYASTGVQSATTGSIAIPVNALLGTTRMRVAMRFGQGAAPCSTYDYGEVEDYCITILTPGTVSIEKEILNQLVVYPNPFKDVLNISFTNTTLNDLHVNLYDIRGSHIKSQQYQNLSSGQVDLKMATEGLKAGMYFLDVQLGEEHIHRKLTLVK